MLQWIRARSRRDLVLACAVAIAAFLGVGAFLARSVDSVRHRVEHEARHLAEYSNQGGAYIDQVFALGEQGRLEIRVGEVDVAVSNGSGDARVVVRADDGKISADSFEDLGFVIDASDGTLSIRTEERAWNRGDQGDLDLGLEGMVPDGFDIYIETGDGDVAVGSFEGEVHVQTGDGDVAVGGAEGSLLRIRTGDGDIAIGGAAARTVSLNTGDGDVAVASLSADEITVRTGDGDINIQNLAGPLEASTGDGDVMVHVREFEGIDIRSGDGDIMIAAPAGIAADVHLTGSEFALGEAFALPVHMDRRTVEGSLNGGGAELSVRVGDGTIRIIER